MIEQSIVHLPELVKDIDRPVSNYLVHLSRHLNHYCGEIGEPPVPSDVPLAPHTRWRLSGAPLATRTMRIGNLAPAALPCGACGHPGYGTLQRWSSCRSGASFQALRRP